MSTSELRRPLKTRELESFLSTCSPETKVYIGSDSECFRVRGVDVVEYCVAIVVHIDGCHGCKVFGEVLREPAPVERLNKPFNRMIRETTQAIEMYQRTEDIMVEYGFEPEVHLDINPKESEGSSCALKAAIGMVMGTINVMPLAKPDAFAASFTADRLDRVLREQNAA